MCSRLYASRFSARACSNKMDACGNTTLSNIYYNERRVSPVRVCWEFSVADSRHLMGVCVGGGG